ncbi:hypothetical protein CEXT_153521 [Caerostris extrusa]|uniref:Uncharacterized protein n=1 Tax=Caerostris extrusa TaxID=172846 RepID=A0AAV4PNK6_CAEEX|nr:hypothetical protein CEXT_153521 [Caerostris extrusa]
MIACLKISSFEVPSLLVPGDSAYLTCLFDLAGRSCTPSSGTRTSRNSTGSSPRSLHSTWLSGHPEYTWIPETQFVWLDLMDSEVSLVVTGVVRDPSLK